MGREIEETGHIWKRGNIVSPFDVLKEAGGWYQCPKDSQGKEIEPACLIRGEIGDEYVNDFAKIKEKCH